MYEADGDESKLRSTLLPHRDYRICRHDRAHGRFLSACKALAQIRKLLGVNVQINIAEQQVNVAG